MWGFKEFYMVKYSKKIFIRWPMPDITLQKDLKLKKTLKSVELL